MKKNFICLLPFFLISLIVFFSPGIKASEPDKVLQDDSLLAVFDSNTGALVRMERKSTHWIIERRAELGVSFRLHVPLPERRYNFILGQKQHAEKIEKISENEIRFHWKNLISEYGGTLPITLTAVVTLKDGALTFKMTVENNSPLIIESIDYPYLGDLGAPSKSDNMHVRTMWYDNLESDEIYPHFVNSKGYWGDFFPTKTFGSFRSLFCLIQTQRQGLYVEMHDPTQPYLLEYTFEQHPGLTQSVNNIVPEEDEISGLPVHLEFRTCHFVFAHSGSTFQMVPVTLRCYSGDWHNGVDLYKQWRASWFKPPHTPQWINEVHSWLQLQVNSPEQNYGVSYSGLVKYGKECADNGVKAIQLVGWNLGGQDGCDPIQDTDPGLGTWKELYDAIARIQDMGVKIILFGKLNWADKSTDWYKQELYKYAATDPYGNQYEHGGYSYYTPTQLAGINNKRRAVMDFLCPSYQSVIVKEFQKVMELGASGWLFDENCHHGGVLYNFSNDHSYKAPGFLFGGDMPLAAKLRSEADKISPDFIFAGEGHQDWLMQYYSTSYFRIDGSSTAIGRYIDPKAPLMVAVTGINDREMLNTILMNRYIISYEPYNFKGHVTDFPLTLDYGKKIDALRIRYKEWLWDAEFHDTKGAEVNADGAFRYSVFVTNTGKRSIVIINTEFDKGINARVKLQNPLRLVTATPEQPDSKPFSGRILIPPRSAVVVMEK